jgi:uncharacterized protein
MYYTTLDRHCNPNFHSEQVADRPATPAQPQAQIPLVDYLVLDDDPFLRAHECEECGALYFDRRNACAQCSGREFRWRDLERTGTLRAFTIVRRASPRIRTPYVSAVIDLDGGGTVKANLLGVGDDASAITPRMQVELTTWSVATDDDGTEALAFGFVPAGGAR